MVDLPELVALREGAEVPRAAFVRWSSLLASQPPPGDLVAALWSLADAVQAGGLDESVLLAALASPASPDVNAVLPWIQALSQRADARVTSASAWRSERDRSLVASRAIAAAATSLLDLVALASALAAPPRPRRRGLLPARRAPRPPARVAPPAHRRAPRSRGAPPRGPRDGRALPETRRPLTILEAMMRGHGIEVYAREVQR